MTPDQNALDGMPPPAHKVTVRVSGDVIIRFSDPAGLPKIGDPIRLPQKQATVVRLVRTAGKDEGSADELMAVVTVDRVTTE